MATLNRDTSSNGDYNVNHIDTRYHFYMIGDMEIYSGSRTNETDFSNHRRFFNRQNISTDVYKNLTYNSYIP